VDDADPVASVMEHVLAYLRVHPRARDTAEGIVQWWLPRESRPPHLFEVKQALECLVAAGQIRAEPVPGGATVYGRARESENSA
jgi:hypothetical protein